MKSSRHFILGVFFILATNTGFLQSSFLLASEECLACHGNQTEGIPFVNPEKFSQSLHGDFACSHCHADIAEYPHPEQINKVLCSSCHTQQESEYKESIHGKARAKNISDAADCASCHGEAHAVFPKSDPRSSIYHLNLPQTCGKCHSDPEMAKKYNIPIENAYELYKDSIHGHAVMDSGLLVAANCSSCHGSHQIKPHQDPDSKVHRNQIPETCGDCHAGILATYKKSIHGQLFEKGNTQVPVCTSCHQGHKITTVEKDQWKLAIISECGDCHQEALKTYRESYHGKVTNLGYTQVARCSDCHGYHNILSSKNPHSTLYGEHRIETCGRCHEGASANFVKYLPHADHTDKENYPLLYYIYIGFSALLAGTFGFWWLHSLLWGTRGYLESRKKEKTPKKTGEESQKYYWRFSLYHRVTHILIIISFLGLAATGIPLKFNDRPWAIDLAHFLGGFQTMGIIHRFCAILTGVYCLMHLFFLFKVLMKEKNYGILWGPHSLVPQYRDLIDLWNHFKWFVGKGPHPKFGRWTYWEKFDYWAVFWGIAMIGISGLILWFPTSFAKFLPGWIVNIATIIHSDEALLAFGFIFTIHFFNNHLRPEKFPMDQVIFTGRLSEEELKKDKRGQYEELKASGKLKSLEAPKPDSTVKKFASIFGYAAVIIGLTLILLVLLVW